MAKAAPSAPVMNHLSPLMTQPPSPRGARVCSIVGSEPAPGAGSVIAKQERICAVGQRPQVALLLLGVRDALQQVHVALVRRGAVHAPAARAGCVPASSNSDARRSASRARGRPTRRQVRAVDAGRAGPLAQRLRRRPWHAARLAQLVLERQHLVAHERGHARLQVALPVGQLEVDHCAVQPPST